MKQSQVSACLWPALIREGVSSAACTTPYGPLCGSSRDLLLESVIIRVPRLSVVRGSLVR